MRHVRMYSVFNTLLRVTEYTVSRRSWLPAGSKGKGKRRAVPDDDAAEEEEEEEEEEEAREESVAEKARKMAEILRQQDEEDRCVPAFRLSCCTILYTTVQYIAAVCGVAVQGALPCLTSAQTVCSSGLSPQPMLTQVLEPKVCSKFSVNATVQHD